MILALFVFGVWAGVWRWVVKCRGTWNLIFANLAGAAAGFIVSTVVLIIHNGFFPVEKPDTTAAPVTQAAPKNPAG